MARESQACSVAAYEEAVRLAFVRFWGGLASYFEVLEAQNLLFPAENRLAQIELARLRALVQLYKALGGVGLSIRFLGRRVRRHCRHRRSPSLQPRPIRKLPRDERVENRMHTIEAIFVATLGG